MTRRLAPGTTIEPRQLTTVRGDSVALPDPESLVHVQFRRFAGCPICHLHLRSTVRRHDEIRAAGIREVVFFHTGADELWEHTDALPFDVIADPDRHVYRRFGVERGRRSLLHPGTWWAVLYGGIVLTIGVLRNRALAPDRKPEGGRLGLPADFLIAPNGRLLAAKYGDHADDQWSVDQLLELAARASDDPLKH